MMSTHTDTTDTTQNTPPFLLFWCTDRIRDTFLSCLPREDLRSLRLACYDFSVCAAPFLFEEVDVEFRSSTFTRPARMAALERIGSYVKSLTFSIPHSPATFLPPLLDPVSGEEQLFVYSPQIHDPQTPGCRSGVPKYGSWEMTDLLTKQYPPLFHAATNVPSFIRAFNAMPSLARLTVSCGGQASGHRYRRSVVDYALISLRIAVEQAPLTSLDSFSLLPIHPGALLYLRSNMGFGASPRGRKRWSQIKNLTVQMDSFYPVGNQPTDHLKFLHSYLEGFPALSSFIFRWQGGKGPCPLSLATEPCLTRPDKVENALTNNKRGLRPLKFPKLQYMEVENVELDATQVSAFIMEHRHTVGEFNYEQTELRSGTWDEALAPLTRLSGRQQQEQKQQQQERQRSRRQKNGTGDGEVMDVPIVFSPMAMEMGHIRQAMWEQDKQKTDAKRNRHLHRDLQRHLREILAVGDGAGTGTSAAGGRTAAGVGSFQRATSRTRELLWKGPDHMKRLLGSSMFCWR